MAVLAEVIRYAQEQGLLVILDAKRNDIGSTAAAYAEGSWARNSAWGADALTVSPYLGDDSLKPFVDVAVQRSAGVFVLVKTSNPGGRMFQDLVADGRPLYRHVAAYVEGAGRGDGRGVRLRGRRGGGRGDLSRATRRTARRMPHTGSSCRATAARGQRPRDVAAGLRCPGRRGDREQFPRDHLRLSPAALRRAVRRRAMAGGGRGRHAGHDRALRCRDARGGCEGQGDGRWRGETR